MFRVPYLNALAFFSVLTCVGKIICLSVVTTILNFAPQFVSGSKFLNKELTSSCIPSLYTYKIMVVRVNICWVFKH
jgi:hypothetical protein